MKVILGNVVTGAPGKHLHPTFVDSGDLRGGNMLMSFVITLWLGWVGEAYLISLYPSQYNHLRTFTVISRKVCGVWESLRVCMCVCMVLYIVQCVFAYRIVCMHLYVCVCV